MSKLNYDIWTLIIKYLDDNDLNSLMDVSRDFRVLIRNECKLCDQCDIKVFEGVCDSMLLCHRCFIDYTESYSVDICREGASDGRIGISLKYKDNAIWGFDGFIQYENTYDNSGYYPEWIDTEYILGERRDNFNAMLNAINRDDPNDIHIHTDLELNNGIITILSGEDGMIEFYNENKMVLRVGFWRIKSALISIYEHLLDVCVHYMGFLENGVCDI